MNIRHISVGYAPHFKMFCVGFFPAGTSQYIHCYIYDIRNVIDAIKVTEPDLVIWSTQEKEYKEEE